MIVPNMNSAELTKEIFTDYPSVVRKAMYLKKSLRRKAIKSKSKHYHQIFDYKSIRNNNWLIIVDYYVAEPTFQVIVYYLNEFGFNAILVGNDGRTLTHYNSHFLNRFNERYLKETNISKLDILKRFFAMNSVGVLEFVDDSEGKTKRFFGRVREGIFLGFIEYINYLYQIIHMKTFITNDMIFYSQNNAFDMTSERYRTYWDEMFRYTKLSAF